jgi:hypothetical protein
VGGSRKNLFRIPDPESQIQGSQRHQISDPGSGSATLQIREAEDWFRMSRGSFPSEDEAGPPSPSGLRNSGGDWQVVGVTRSWEDEAVSQDLQDKIIHALRNSILTQVPVPFYCTVCVQHV